MKDLTFISFTLENFITIFLMAFFGFTVLNMVTDLVISKNGADNA